jgi:hypothetical protein
MADSGELVWRTNEPKAHVCLACGCPQGVEVVLPADKVLFRLWQGSTTGFTVADVLAVLDKETK